MIFNWQKKEWDIYKSGGKLSSGFTEGSSFGVDPLVVETNLDEVLFFHWEQDR